MSRNRQLRESEEHIFAPRLAEAESLVRRRGAAIVALLAKLFEPPYGFAHGAYRLRVDGMRECKWCRGLDEHIGECPVAEADAYLNAQTESTG